MILLTHIIIALAGLATSTYAFFIPSKKVLGISYGLVGFTVASGTYLTLTGHGHLLQSCTTGIVYLAAVSVGMVRARRQLAHAITR